jgi:hypothetical protein
MATIVPTGDTGVARVAPLTASRVEGTTTVRLSHPLLPPADRPVPCPRLVRPEKASGLCNRAGSSARRRRPRGIRPAWTVAKAPRQ